MDWLQALILGLSLWGGVFSPHRDLTLGVTYPAGGYLRVEGGGPLHPALPLQLYGGVYLRSFQPYVSGRVGLELSPCFVGLATDYPLGTRVFVECRIWNNYE